MKYLVTGATGFIGGCLAKQLVQSGHMVVALVRNPEKATHLSSLGIKVHQGDITNLSSLRGPMTGVDGVFHLAAWYNIGTRDKRAAYHVNVHGTRQVLKMAKDLNIPKIVYTSTLAVFSDTGGKLVDETFHHKGPWLSEYDRTKWIAHYEVATPLAKAGLPLVIVQPGVVYGPNDTSAIGKALNQYLKGKLPLTPAETAFCWAHVEDTAGAHLLAMEKGRLGESYIIAGPVHRFRAVFELAERITGIKAPSFHPTPKVMRTMAAGMKLLETVLPLPPPYTAESLRVIAGTTYIGSNNKARHELGFKPRPLEKGLKETLLYELHRLGLSD